MLQITEQKLLTSPIHKEVPVDILLNAVKAMNFIIILLKVYILIVLSIKISFVLIYKRCNDCIVNHGPPQASDRQTSLPFATESVTLKLISVCFRVTV